MQISFYTDHEPQYFSEKQYNAFPSAPERCPGPNCSMPIKLKKHGFYSRYFISKKFKGLIYIRRYICPVCGMTVSMLPMFCIPMFQYSGIDILNSLHELYQGEISLRELIKRLKRDLPTIERRHINYYRKRIANNRGLIQYGLNLMSPEFTIVGGIPETKRWVKSFLDKVFSLHPHVFIVDFSKITGKSFMTLQNMIA